MRRTIAKLNSYLLVCNLHPVWCYVNTAVNPADRPSRRKVKKKMGKVAKRHVEGRTKSERVAVRKKLGPLQNLTVQSRTKTRYERARFAVLYISKA